MAGKRRTINTAENWDPTKRVRENWDPTKTAGKWFRQMQWAWGIHEIVTTNTARA